MMLTGKIKTSVQGIVSEKVSAVRFDRMIDDYGDSSSIKSCLEYLIARDIKFTNSNNSNNSIIIIDYSEMLYYVMNKYKNNPRNNNFKNVILLLLRHILINGLTIKKEDINLLDDWRLKEKFYNKYEDQLNALKDLKVIDSINLLNLSQRQNQGLIDLADSIFEACSDKFDFNKVKNSIKNKKDDFSDYYTHINRQLAKLEVAYEIKCTTEKSKNEEIGPLKKKYEDIERKIQEEFQQKEGELIKKFNKKVELLKKREDEIKKECEDPSKRNENYRKCIIRRYSVVYPVTCILVIGLVVGLVMFLGFLWAPIAYKFSKTFKAFIGNGVLSHMITCFFPPFNPIVWLGMILLAVCFGLVGAIHDFSERYHPENIKKEKMQDCQNVQNQIKETLNKKDKCIEENEKELEKEKKTIREALKKAQEPIIGKYYKECKKDQDEALLNIDNEILENDIEEEKVIEGPERPQSPPPPYPYPYSEDEEVEPETLLTHTSNLPLLDKNNKQI